MEVIGLGRLQCDRLAFDFGKFFHAAFFLINPFGGAADGGSLCRGDGLVRKKGVDGIAGIAAGDQRFAGIIVHAALIPQLALGIEDEKVGSGGRAEGAGDFLVLAVVEIREIEMAIGSADSHFVERVADVGVAHLVEPHSIGIVGLDGDEGDAAVLVIRSELLDAGFVELRGGAMVAGKGDDENLARGVIGETVSLAVNGWEAKVRGGGAEGEGRRAVLIFARGGMESEKKENAWQSENAAAKWKHGGPLESGIIHGWPGGKVTGNPKR